MIGKIFSELYKAYGDQQWWSSYTPFEMMLAALLAQHTSQSYRENSIAILKKNNVLTAEKLSKTSIEKLAIWTSETNTPTNLSHKKAKQIKHYSHWYLQQGGFEALNKLDMLALRNALLAMDEMDKETADIILLYAFKRPAFIIDEDTRRIFYRLELINGDEPHDELRHIIALSIDQDAELFNEYHALLAQHAIAHCRPEPNCKHCPLDKICPE